MKFLYTQLNTLSMPIRDSRWQITPRILLATLLFAGISVIVNQNATAGVQHYQAPINNVSWETTSKKRYCSLSHDIPLYGTATFAQSAGAQLAFTLTAKRKASRNRDRAHLRAQPPGWKHHISAVDFGEVAIHKGGTPFQLKEDLSRRLLVELQKGMFPTFSYRDWADARDQITVSLPGINIKPVLGEFMSCLAQLPVYKFADFKDSLLYFAFGKSTLRKKDRQRLDSLVRYIKTDPELNHIDIIGHTDNVGGRRSNDKLSQRRSQTVKSYLIAKGISPQLFKLKSLGEHQPKSNNLTSKGRATNRRVQLTLIKKPENNHHAVTNNLHDEDNDRHSAKMTAANTRI